MSAGNIESLLSWAINSGAAIDSRISFIRTQDRGIIATFNSEKIHTEYESSERALDNKMIRIPSKICVTPDKAAQHFGIEFSSKVENVNHLTKLFLAKERLNKDSYFTPYLTLLPSLTEINSPLTWSEKELSYLQSTNLGNVIKDKLSSIVEEWFHVISLIPESIEKPDTFYMDMKFNYEYKFYKADELIDYLTENFKSGSWTNFASYLWANLIFTSRSFPYYLINDKAAAHECMLLPVIDLLNHKQGASVEWSCGYDSGKTPLFEFNSQSAKDGEELYNNYGFKGNEELLMGYGFALPKNEADTVALRIKVPTEMIPSIESFGISLPDINDYTNSICYDTKKTSKDTSARYKQYGNGVLFFIKADFISDDLINLFSYLVKKESEQKFTLRMKLDGISNLRNAIEQKLSVQNAKIPDQDPTIKNLHYIQIYYQSQKSILNSAKKSLKSIEKDLLNENKLSIIQLKKIWNKDLKFKNSLLISMGVTSHEQILDSNFEDHTWLLWLIRCHNKANYPEKDVEDNYMPDWIVAKFDHLKTTYTITDNDRSQFKDLYSALIPNLIKVVPEVYGVGKWGLEELILSAKLLEMNSYCRGSQGELILVEDKYL